MTRRPDLRILLALVILAVGFFLGTVLRDGAPTNGESTTQERGMDAGGGAEAGATTIWTCSMHPQIRLPSPGKCPICFMDLIPLENDSAGADSETRLSMSEAARELAEIVTTPVRRRYPHMELRLVGKVEYDETRLRKISAWVAGRLDRLYVDYTGVSIRKGDHLVWMYSPALVSAQEELLQSISVQRELLDSGARVLRSTADQTVVAAREKLRLLGLTDDQIRRIEERGAVEDHMTIYAPIDGVVIARHAVVGSYVEVGSPIYEIADLSRVWVKMDAYESHLAWLRYGQQVTFTTEAYPGHTLTGRIAFIDPVLDPRTRTAKVRVNIDNDEGLLKPGMFVRATVFPEIASAGRVMVADLADKWMCPMHPEVISDRPGACTVCGMPLVRPEKLGYSVASKSEEPPLVIPSSAPLITGRRAVVYVRVPGTERPTFEGREVVLGPRAGDWYVVESGLAEGELVVEHGAFKIDSAMQIQAKPSMMNPRTSGGEGGAGHEAEMASFAAPPAFQLQLGSSTEAYLDLTAALANDDFGGAHQAAEALEKRLAAVDMTLLAGDAHMEWMGLLRDLGPAASTAARAEDIGALRATLSRLTATLDLAIKTFGVQTERSVLLFHCPMARDGEGADWLQSSTTTANPYYGASMLRCGDLRERLSGESE